MKILAVLLSATLALAACTPQTPIPVNPTPSGSPSVSVSADPEVLTLQVRAKDGYRYITDHFGRAVYVYGGDNGSEVSRCTDVCPDNYFPVLAPDTVKAGAGLSDQLIGVGGQGQVMYKGKLLYYYHADAYPDLDPQGTGVSWYLINDQGIPIGIA